MTPFSVTFHTGCFAPEQTLTPEQWRFLALHKRLVVKWQWHMKDTLLRAYTDRGYTATISRSGFDALLNAGLIETLGCAGVRLTSKGVEAVG